MLVLSRKKKQAITIGDEIKVTVLSIKGNHVRLGIEAPEGLRILRTELVAADPEPDGEETGQPEETNEGASRAA